MHREEQALAARLDRLAGELSVIRRENLRLKLLGIVAVFLTLGGSYALTRLPRRPDPDLMPAPAIPAEQRAGTLVVQSISIVDGAGKTRIAIAGGENPGIEMYDEDGSQRLGFGLGIEGAPNLSFDHKKLRTRMQLGLQSWDGVPYLDVFDEKEDAIHLLDDAGKPVPLPK